MALLHLPWRAAAADLDEGAYLVGADPFVGALNVAVAKARATPSSDDEIVLAADTLVVDSGRILGKPENAAAATAMLRRLRGKAHQVLTGVALRAANAREWGAVVSTSVVMRAYADAEIDAYVKREEPFDKAGGYAVQDEAFRPAARLEGCYLNVVGLPLCGVAAGLNALGEAVQAGGRPPCGYCRAGEGLVAIRSGY
jgi:MAF protein